MDFWGILEIERTDNLSIIKKAYAAKLKTNHPEDNPEGFQTLKEAYDYAVKYAKSVQKQKSVIQTFIGEEVNCESAYTEASCELQAAEPIENDCAPVQPGSNSFYSYSYDLSSMNVPFQWENANNEILVQMDTLYSDFSERIKIENWAKLLNQDVLWNIENKTRLEPRVLYFLSTHYYLPKEIYLLLDDSFNFRSNVRELSHNYGEKFTTYVMNVLCRPFPINYNYISKMEEPQYDGYLELKEKIYYNLQNKDPREAEKLLIQARQLCDSDPDLIRMHGIICYIINKFDQAISLFSEALAINFDDLESHYYRAKALFIKNYSSAALNDINSVLSALPCHQDAILLAINCNLKQKNLLPAQELIIRGFNLASDNQTYQSLVNLKTFLEKKLQLRTIARPWEIKQNMKLLKQLRHASGQYVENISLPKRLGKYALYAFLAVCALFLASVTRLGVLVLIYLAAMLVNKKK